MIQEPDEIHSLDFQQKISYLPDIHRLLPQSQDAEQGILSSYLLAPEQVGDLCSSRHLTHRQFHHPVHATIYDILHTAWGKREFLDVIQLTQRLRDANLLDRCGGPSFVTQLFTFLPTAANAAFYLEIMQEKYTLREMIRVCTEIAAKCYDEQDRVSELYDYCERALSDFSAMDRHSIPRPSTSQVVHNLMAKIRSNDREKLFGTPTGFPRLDAAIGGLARGDLILIQGQKSSGKSAFALTLAERMDRLYGRTVAYFTFEMTAEQQVRRLIQMRCGENIRAVLDEQGELLGGSRRGRVEREAAAVSQMKIEFFNQRPATLSTCVSELRRLHARTPIGMAVLDYDELLEPEAKRYGGKEESLSAIASTWKNLAGELDCPMILISQVTLGKDGEVKSRWSQAKENFANIMLLVKENGNEAQRVIQVQKNRDGGRNMEIEFSFVGKITRFMEEAE